MRKRFISLFLCLAFVLALMPMEAFALKPEYNPYIDRRAIIASDFSVTWDQVEAPEKYDMCLYPLNSGSPTFLNFKASDMYSTGLQYHIGGKFLKDAVTERAAKDGLTGVTTFALRINEVNATKGQLIDYSYFKVDLSTMKIIEHSFTEIKEIHLIFDLKTEDHPITTDTPHVSIAHVTDYESGMPFTALYKAGKHTLNIQILADEGYVLDSAMDVTIDGKSVKLTSTNMWAGNGYVYVEVELEKDEIHGKAPSLWEKFVSALRNFFFRIRIFFGRIFGFGMPI